MFLENFKIGTKLITGFLLLTGVLVAVGLLGYQSISDMNKKTVEIIQTAPLRNASMEMKYAIARDMQMIMELLAAGSQDELNEMWKKHEGHVRHFDIFADGILNGSETDEGTIYAAKDEKLRSIVNETENIHSNEFQNRIRNIYDLKSKQFALGKESKEAAELQEKIDAADKEADNVGEKMIIKLGGVEDRAKEVINAASLASQETVSASLTKSIAAIGIGFILSISMGLYLTRIITRPLRESVNAANRLADGDLNINIEVKSKDETGQMLSAMKNMVNKLRGITGQIRGSAGTIASSSEELSATTEQITSGINEQSNQLEQSSAATTEVSQTIIEVARNAADASESAKESVGIANDGKSVVEQTVSSMMKIAENVETSSQTIGELGESSKKIGDIIGVINDIASQTNLLALNAAIEAARAGEQGRGFAVVADEVRKLAEKTAKATEEITGMINKIQGDTDVSVKGMEKNKLEADEGVKLAGEAKESLDKIVNASERCLDQVNSIAAASEQQSAAVEEVSSNIENIAGNFGASRDAVSQISQSTVELSQISNELMNLISWFKMDSNFGSLSDAADYTDQINNEYEAPKIAMEPGS